MKRVIRKRYRPLKEQKASIICRAAGGRKIDWSEYEVTQTIVDIDEAGVEHEVAVLCDSPGKGPALEIAKALNAELKTLCYADRVALRDIAMNGYCRHCGSDVLPCYCERDD